jgi:Fe-S-cluster containining protein
MISVQISTPAGTIQGSLRIPPHPMRLSELALSFMSVSDRLVSLASESEARDGRTVSCRRGCTACCRHIVPLSPPEAWLVSEMVVAMPPSRRARRLEAFRAAREAYTRIGARNDTGNPSISEEDALRMTVEYFRQGVPCPFLEDGSCSIYAWRPSICREYAVTSPAENCFRLPDLPIARLPVPVRLSKALSTLTGKLLDREPEEIPLTLALDWALENRDDGLRTWDPARLIRDLLAELTSP